MTTTRARVIVLIGHTHRPSNSLPIEGVVAIGSGISARSVTLLAFDIDSVIELVSAGVLIWRLTVELRHGLSFAKAAEHMASRIGGVLLLARFLCRLGDGMEPLDAPRARFLMGGSRRRAVAGSRSESPS